MLMWGVHFSIKIESRIYFIKEITLIFWNNTEFRYVLNLSKRSYSLVSWLIFFIHMYFPSVCWFSFLMLRVISFKFGCRCCYELITIFTNSGWVANVCSQPWFIQLETSDSLCASLHQRWCWEAFRNSQIHGPSRTEPWFGCIGCRYAALVYLLVFVLGVCISFCCN